MTSNGSPVNIVDSTKYLEVVIDHELNYKHHIKMIKEKKACSVGILFELKHFFPQNIMSQLHDALVHLFLSCGIIIWEATYPIYGRRLKSLQNQAILTATRCHYRDEVNPYYNQFKIFQIDDLIKNEIAKFAHCNIIHLAIIYVKLLNTRAKLRDNQVVIRIFIFHATKQTNCKGALNIRESRYGIPFLKKLRCYLIKDLKFSRKFFC